MGNSYNVTSGSAGTSMGGDSQRDGGVGAAHMAEKQGQVIKPMKGARMASARIRRGDILEWYSFEGKVLGKI